ncbi:hypothetical protein HFP57_00830 [Parasphingopyxis algicola]|uniref:hypothetical protein n=1 Tax=Parasphingopyxis algicola TaxID=2026624 RepID=UPI0015A0B1A9|nr:hypothetical protein [Parasphingopyxis algicola]QLC23717.1 hypothetical protein HFP57_00830 [Parasphingopyxis algicola]
MSRSKGAVRAASAVLTVLIPFFALLAISGVVLFWGFGVHRIGNAALGENFIVLLDQPPVPERRLYGLVATLPALLFWLYASWRLFLMFRAFHTGPLIGPVTIRHLRAYALFSALAVLSAFLLSGVMRWALGQFDDAPLWTHLGFSVTHGLMLFSSAILYVASHVIEEGYAYRKETEEYV